MLIVAVIAGVVAIALVAVVITARRASARADRLELAVERSNEQVAEAVSASRRLTAGLDVIAHGVVIADASGHVVFRNLQATTFVGARHGDALVEQAVTEMLAAGCRGVTDKRTLELFGPPRRTIVVTVSPLQGDGSTVGALAAVDDITERTRLEAVRTDFVANISHELKTPVGALALLAETLLAEDDPAFVNVSPNVSSTKPTASVEPSTTSSSSVASRWNGLRSGRSCQCTS